MQDRSSPIDPPLYRYRFGAAEFDEARMELNVGGLVVDMEQRPLGVLATLLTHVDEVVSRQALFDAVWRGRLTVDNVLSNAIVKLRKALGDESGERIVTVPRVGYKLLGPVLRIAVERRSHGWPDLSIGMPVPGREHFLLSIRMGAARGSEVWLARHFKTHEQRVYKFSPDGERLASLKREATLSRLLQESLTERDCFVRIMDWNFETLPFYLECEYGGANLGEWAAQENRLACMAPAERIVLFLQIADAVSAAHGVGVLHKDLKPANILVEAREAGLWRLRVADFGSARLLEPGRLRELGITEFGAAPTEGTATSSGLGTPLYMAPELIAGQPPTVQSDVYSLGLILYQLAVGDLRRPLAPGWESEIGDELLREDIAAATDGRPARRLTSVADLILRLRTQSVRNDERASARVAQARMEAAEALAERTRVRRPWVLGLVTALALGLLMSLLLYQGQRRARLEAERETRLTEQINRFLSEDLLGAADPSGPGGAHNPTMRDVLEGTAARLDARFPADPEAKASIDMALSNAYFGMTDYAAAERYRRAAVQQLTDSRGPGDSRTLAAEYPLISLLIQTNRLDEAGRMLDLADGLAGVRIAGNSELSLKAHWTRAAYYKLRMAPDQALVEYRAADAVRAAVDPNDDSMMFRLRDALSWCYARLDRNADAEQVLRDLIVPGYTPERVGPVFWAQARVDYGIALRSLGRNADAERIMTEALTELRRSLGPDHFFVAVVQNELGDLYVRQARWPEAVDSLRDAYAILRKRSGEHGQATLIAGANLGIVDYRTGHSEEAVQVLTAAHVDLVKQLGVSSPQAQSVAFYLACALAEVGRVRDAADLVPPLTVADLDAAEPRADWALRLQALRGDILVGQGRVAEGLAQLNPAIASMETARTSADDLSPFRKMREAAQQSSKHRSVGSAVTAAQ